MAERPLLHGRVRGTPHSGLSRVSPNGRRAERSDLLAIGGASTSGLFGDRTRNFYVMYREMTHAG